MGALSAARNTKSRTLRRISRTVAAGSTVYQGGLVTLLAADGTAVPAGTANAGAAVGIALDTVVGDGELTVEIEAGCFQFANSAAGDLIAAADTGATCYIVDDQTVAKTDNAGARKAAGVIGDVDANGVWVVVGQVT